METREREAAPPQLPADEDASRSVGQTSLNQLGAQSHRHARQDQRPPRLETDGWELQHPRGRSLQSEFQNSNLSPALSLLPSNSAVEHNFTEYSLFQQSDNEFVPLRAYPDISMASERFHFPPLDRTTQASECGSLSQHSLAQATNLSEGVSSCCSLSQHSLSLLEESRREETTDRPGVASRGASSREKVFEMHTDPPDRPGGEAAEDDTLFLRKDIPAQHLLKLLQKDIGMPSSCSSSSAVSSGSETSVKVAASYAEQSKSTEVCKPSTDRSMVRREGPPGEAALPQQQTQQPDKDLYPDQSRPLSSEACNITMGSRGTKPDDSSDVLHRELLSEVESCSRREAGSKNQQRKSPTSPDQADTPYPTGASEGKQSETRTNMGGLQWTGAFSAGVERGHREQDLWFTGNQTGIDGSYLGFLPQSQSTPGFFKAPPKSSAKAKVGQLAAIESINNSDQSHTGISPQPDVPTADVHPPDKANQSQEEAATSAKVQSLPSLNYMQKVDAWRANQSSGNPSLFDSLALQGFSGISPKKKAYDAVADPLNHILSQQVRSLQQPAVSSAVNQTVPESSSTAPCGSPSRRGEAVGSAPGDKDNTGSAARPSDSPFGRSQSQSSLSTIVRSVQKDQQKKRPADEEASPIQDDVHHEPRATVELSPLLRLGLFSDESLDRDLTLSSSQDSYNSGAKLGTGASSSVVSLEVDNYAPHWTSKQSTPPPLPRPRELNIEERIPLYLRNLGIDQSPSTILTPFTPRGPIREPEFSPTDLCTIKGSVGTPTKSTQTSEGGSPHKREFSRCSVLSVDSSVSIPLSLDSLVRRGSPSLDTDAIQSKRRLATSFLPEEDSYPSTQQQHMESSHNTIQPGDSQMSRSLEQSAESSIVNSSALMEIRKLLSQAENVLSAGSSEASSASPAASRLLSDDDDIDILRSLRNKSSRLRDPSFSSSSAAEDPRSQRALLWARSTSDSMLSSERRREGSIGQESMTSLRQPNNSSTQALVTAPTVGAYRRPQDGTVARGSGASVVLSQSARRAEPEGCSAAPPDGTAPPQPPAVTPSPVLSAQQLTSTPAEDTEEGKPTTMEDPEWSVPSSPTFEENDQAGMSDGSSKSSLAFRVVKLLQSESPATMVSSASSTDQEESKAREWIKLKLSGQQCEPLELDKEDRKRIEEIKRELLLKKPMKNPGSTDTESSAASSVRVLKGPDPPAETPAPLGDPNNQPPKTLQGLKVELSGSSVPLHNPLRPDLEAQIQEIAAREKVTLPRTNLPALTSITITSCRRSTSPSPSTSPAPPLSPPPEMLHLAELSTRAAERPKVNRAVLRSTDEEEEDDEAAREPSSDPTPLSAPGNLKREDTVGGQLEDPPPPSLGLGGEDVNAEDDNTQSFRRDDNISVHISSVSGVRHEAQRAAGFSTSEPAATTGHVSHVHLTLSPKATDRSSAIAVHSSGVTALPHKEFVPLRHSSATSSPDEGVGLSSPPEWYDSREPKRQRAPERAEASPLFKTAVPQGRKTSASTPCFTPCLRAAVSPRPFTTETPAAPVLLPYKPHGSEELFYMPQSEADVSPSDPSDTTMESSHPGSDDAVPPRFSSEVLGHRDAGLDRGVAIRHSEGIYSKRLKTATFTMHEPGRRASVSTDGTSQTTGSPAPKPSPQVSGPKVPLLSPQTASKRDQGTSPVQFPGYDQPERSRVRVQPVHVDYDKAGRVELLQERRASPLPHPAARQSSSPLDQLWERFCDGWSLEGSRPTSGREASLLERLERLSRLIHSSRATDMSELREGEPARRGEAVGERKRSAGCEARGTERKVRGGRKVQDEPPVTAVQTASQPEDQDGRDSFTSSFSRGSSRSQHLCPADRDESETLSTASGSGSMSTVDTERLIRAFGAHRVQHLKTGSGLSKLYGAINKQKEGREQRRGRITPLETTGTDESTVAADSTSASASSRPPHRGPSRTLAAKKAVKLVSRGIQAGGLELVGNGTRRHTRDVGTTFPSPGEARTSPQTSSSSSGLERGRGGRRSPSKSRGSQKTRKSKRSPSKTFPEGVSWFIAADHLRSEARKENRPEEEESPWRPSAAWFEPYSRTQPWREPLRPRQVHEDGIEHAEPEFGPRAKTVSSGLARISLQEALKMRRPEFISQSRRRVGRLALQVEERKLQEVFSRERDKLFSRPGGPGPKPSGTALLRRAVPRKEMIQRSKQIYESLPEVQSRREEERRKVEYRSYRLNAQLYNKRITNRVLGRRTAWQGSNP